MKLIKFSFLFTALLCLSPLKADGHLQTLEAKAPNQQAPNYSSKSGFRNTWTPYFTKTCNVQPQKATFVHTNVAMGFLYFSGVKGNLQPDPSLLGNAAAFAFQISPTKSTRTIQGRLNYNRTPLYEVVFGYQWNNFIKTGFSFQAQSNVSVFTQAQLAPAISSVAAGTNMQSQFFSDVNLYGLALKGYFTFPYSLVVKMVSITPFVSLGIGPCWQTWKRLTISYRIPRASAFSDLDLNQKISANAFFTTDLGFSTTWLIRNKTFKLVKGTRFNIWGQARSMGKVRDQSFVTVRNFLTNPLRIKTVYQFAPYIGLTFDF